MHYVVEDTPLGTAGAVKMAHELLAGETFLVITGDALTDSISARSCAITRSRATTSRSRCSA